jgi:hypothetical protein
MLMTAAKRTNANGLCITKNMVLQSNLVKLNISTDSLGKYTPDIDGYAQTRFPATAPSKESKEKKMFAALKKEAKGTPKGTKKLPEESQTPNPKPQTPNPKPQNFFELLHII